MGLSNEVVIPISELAKKLGITNRTIRLYEKMGLVDPPRRIDGRIRYYEDAHVKRFKFILKLKQLGLSLEEMQDFARTYNCQQKLTDRIAPHLIELLDAHLTNCRAKAATLQSLERDIKAYRERIGDQYNLIDTAR